MRQTSRDEDSVSRVTQYGIRTMTNSEDLNTPDTLASLSSAKVLEVNGANNGPTSNGTSRSATVTNYQVNLASASPSITQSLNHFTGRRKSGAYLTSDPDGALPPTCSIILPFNPIQGELVIQVAQMTEGEGPLVVTNYRLFIQGRETHSNIPLGLIDLLEVRDIFYLHIHCKDARYIRCILPNNETVTEVVRRVQLAMTTPKKIEDFFACSFQAKVEIDLSLEMRIHLGLMRDPGDAKKRFYDEVKRMEFNVQNPWRVSDENEDFELCGSYPKLIIVPNSIDKKKLEQVACFRSARRFPAVVWRHRGNGAVICRCSQPEVGWFGWRSSEDEELVQNIVQACAYQSYERPGPLGESQTVPIDSFPPASSPSNSSMNGGSSIELVPECTTIVKKLMILDARSYTTAVANRARGGGCECLDYYPNCEIHFMNLANIHSIRKSFINVRQLCALPSEQATWFSQLEGCKWLQHMSGLMKAAVTVATAIEHDGRPVMVHCSDGWDRTPQIVSLAEILLDPYYRSLEGFQVLVEREWLDFGHKFGDRCGQGLGSEDSNERCPVFLQWLDCLHQLLNKFPSAFEFNMAFLVKLVQHTYSNLFGTFLCNTAKEREQHRVADKTLSVWKFLRSVPNQDKFVNSLYISCDKVLFPSCEVRDLVLWSQVYLGYENPPPLLTEAVNPSQESSPAPSVAELETSGRRESSCRPLTAKARSSSYEDMTILHPSKGLQRKLSDSSLYGAQDHETENSSVGRENLHGRPEVEDEESPSPSPCPKRTYAQTSQSGTALLGELDDSENEDTEPNSAHSASTVISAHRFNIKSIESSTDTLVAEMGVSSGDLKLPQMDQLKTELDSPTTIRTRAMSPAYSSPVIENGDGDNLQIVDEIVKATMDLSMNDGDPSNAFTAAEASKLLNMDELGDMGYALNGGVEHCHLPLSMINHCTVCESSQNLLKDSTQSDAVPLGIGNYGNNIHPSSLASSGIGMSRYGGKYSNYNTPGHFRTASSSNSAMHLHDDMGFNGFMGPSNGMVLRERASLDSSLGLRHTLDVDGLTHFHDEVQTIVTGYRTTIDSLQRELQRVRMALSTQVSHKCALIPVDRPDDTVSVTGSIGSFEHHSVISHSSEGSSFEAVDERDTQPPLWVPDYAATHCMGCNVCFGKWLGKRKHHCRACGKIFCAECSENTIQLFHVTGVTYPQRVCKTCCQIHHKAQRDGVTADFSGSSPNWNMSNEVPNASHVSTNGSHVQQQFTASSPIMVPKISQAHVSHNPTSSKGMYLAKTHGGPSSSKFPETHHSSNGQSSNGRYHQTPLTSSKKKTKDQ